MEIDNQVQHASFSSSAFSVFSHKVCVQIGCMEVIPPGRTKPMCDRCWTRQGSFAKRQKTRHDASVTINPATAISSMDSAVKGWNSIDEKQLNTSFANTTRYRHRPSLQPTIRSHSDPSSSYQKMHTVPSHIPSKRPIRLPGAVLMAHASYTFMPAQTTAPHFNSRGELMPVPPAQLAVESRHSLNDVRYCAHCRATLFPKHPSKLCASCYAASYRPPHQPTSVMHPPFLVPSQIRKQPMERTPPDPQISVDTEESRHNSATMHPIFVPSQAQKCSAQPAKPVLEIERPVLSPVSVCPTLSFGSAQTTCETQFQDSRNDTPVDSDIDIDSAELSYPEPTEILPSNSLPPGYQEPTGNQPVDLDPQVANAEILEDPPASPPKPKLSIRIPRRGHRDEQLPSSRDLVSIVPSQNSIDHSDRICSTRGCGGQLHPDAISRRCFSCVVKTWRKRNAKSGHVSNRSFSEKRKKSVSWADEVGGDLECVERRLEYGKSPDCAPPSPRSSDSLNDDKMDVGEDVVIKQPSPLDSAALSCGAVVAPRLTQSPEAINGEMEYPPSNNIPLSESNSPLNSHSPSPSSYTLSISTNFPPNSDPSDDDPPSSDISIDGWTSDLSDLSNTSTDEDETDSRPASQPSGLKIRIPARPRLLDDGVPRCTNVYCQSPLPPDYQWKCCVTCRTQEEGDDKYFSSEAGDCLPRLTSHLPSPPLTPYSDKMPSNVAPGARICAVRGCAQVLPSYPEYHWKLCVPCRHAECWNMTKVAATADTEHDVGSVIPNASHIQEQDTSGDESEDIPLAVASKQRTFAKQTGGSGSQVKLPVSPLHPQYQCLSMLLAEFKSRFISFLEARSRYFLYKLAQENDNRNDVTAFVFDGEFSVVALDFDILGKKKKIAKNALKLKEEVERLSGLQFGENRISTHQGGLVVRFPCRYEVPSFTPTTVDASSGVKTPSKTMQGKLEVAAFADRSHCSFAGQRTVVRFHLVG